MSNFTLTIRTVTDLIWKSQNLIGNLTCSHGKSNNFTKEDGKDLTHLSQVLVKITLRSEFSV